MTSNDDLKLNEEATWPPPPREAGPMTTHSAFLTRSIRESLPRSPISRIYLVLRLRGATGLGYRDCAAAVNEFCDRNGLFLKEGRLMACLTVIPALNGVGFAGLFIANMYIGDARIAAARTAAARHVLLMERVDRGILLCSLFLVTSLMSFFVVRATNRWAQREADKARARVWE